MVLISEGHAKDRQSYEDAIVNELIAVSLQLELT
jgi:hypothetical protein